MSTAHDVVVEAIEKWKKRNPEKKIQARVFEILNEARDSLVLQLIGFRKAWSGGGYEIDRSRLKTTVSKLVEATVQDSVKDWIEGNITKLPQMTQELIEGYKEGYKEIYAMELEAALRKQAKERAWADAGDFLEQFLSDYGLPDVRIKLENEEDSHRPRWI